MFKIKNYHKISGYKVLIWIVFIFGTICRVSQYLYNRSLWLDEAKYYLKIKNFSYLEIFFPDLNITSDLEIKKQTAQVGFFYLTKFISQIFGYSEYVLRLVPLLCGILSLFLFNRMAQSYLTKKESLLALLLFSCSGSLVYYSSEFHQYASDVFIVIILYLIVEKIISLKTVGIKKAISIGILGATCFWFAHPTIFILSASGFILFTFCLINDRSKLLPICIIGLFWLISFTLNYAVYAKYFVSFAEGSKYWQDYMMEMPLSPQNIIAISGTFARFFNQSNPFDWFLWPLYMFFLVQGSISFFRRDRLRSLLLLLPFIMVFTASLMGRYPIKFRVVIFLAPAIFILIAEGVGNIGKFLRIRSLKFTILVTFLISFHPICHAVQGILHPSFVEEIRPLVKLIDKNMAINDSLLVLGCWPAFQYYNDRYKLNKGEIYRAPSGRKPELITKILEQAEAKSERVWILISHDMNSGSRVIEKYFFRNGIDTFYEKRSENAILIMFKADNNRSMDNL